MGAFETFVETIALQDAIHLADMHEVDRNLMQIKKSIRRHEEPAFPPDDQIMGLLLAYYIVMMGEAARRIPKAERAKVYEIDFDALIKLRNRITHASRDDFLSEDGQVSRLFEWCQQAMENYEHQWKRYQARKRMQNYQYDLPESDQTIKWVNGMMSLTLDWKYVETHSPYGIYGMPIWDRFIKEEEHFFRSKGISSEDLKKQAKEHINTATIDQITSAYSIMERLPDSPLKVSDIRFNIEEASSLGDAIIELLSLGYPGNDKFERATAKAKINATNLLGVISGNYYGKLSPLFAYTNPGNKDTSKGAFCAKYFRNKIAHNDYQAFLDLCSEDDTHLDKYKRYVAEKDALAKIIEDEQDPNEATHTKLQEMYMNRLLKANREGQQDMSSEKIAILDQAVSKGLGYAKKGNTAQLQIYMVSLCEIAKDISTETLRDLVELTLPLSSAKAKKLHPDNIHARPKPELRPLVERLVNDMRAHMRLPGVAPNINAG